MNNSFNFKRFWWLVKRHGSENIKTYILSLGILSLFILLITTDSREGGSFYTGLFGLLCLTGTIMATTVFSPWSNFGKSSLYLLLPATTTEKYLAGLFYCIVILIPVFTLFYFFTGYIFITIFRPSANFFNIIRGGTRPEEMLNARVFENILLAFLLLQSLSLIITVWFRKRQFLFSSLIIIFLFLFYVLLVYFLMSAITKTEVTIALMPFYTFGFEYIDHLISPARHETFHFNPLIRNLGYLVWTLAFCLFYVAAWFKLREREL